MNDNIDALDASRIAKHPSELDITTLPPWAQDKLFRAAIERTKRVLSQPGGRERLDAIKAEMRAEKAARHKVTSDGMEGAAKS